ncbi:hypothetical protein VCHA53O466_140105 [Vibrio chagasii]|nr:hypothetical protein VCHA53O466_140105 [Vibrio chagasii]
MQNSSLICVEQEFTHLRTLIDSFWSNAKSLDKQIKAAFNMGLDRGRFWIDDMTAFDFHEEFTGNGGNFSLLRSGVECDGITARYHDALYIFGEWLENQIRDIHRHNQNSFNWSSERKAVTKTLLSNLDANLYKSVRPLELTSAEQQAVIDAYKGYNGQPLRSYSTPEYLSPSIVEDQKEYGDSYVSQLLSQCFFHGVMCSGQKNKRNIITTLSPLYTKLCNSPFNADNGLSIIRDVTGCEFIDFALQIKHPTFSSTSEAIEDFTQIRAEQLRKSKLTKAQVEAEEQEAFRRMSDMTSEILSSILTEENEAFPNTQNYRQVEADIKKTSPTLQVI